MRKITSVLALAAALALAAPQAMAATKGAGHKIAVVKPINRVKKSTLRKNTAMAAKRVTKKRIVSHRKFQKQKPASAV